MAFPYVRQTWTDGVSQTTAARMGVMEQGIYDAHRGPFVLVSHNTTNSVLTSVATALACNNEQFDVDGLGTSTMHDNATNNSRLIARVAGFYLVYAAGVTWSAFPGNNDIKFRDTGASIFGASSFVGADWRVMQTTAMRELSVNDYVECMVTQVSGGTITVAAGFEFGMVRVA